MSFSVIIPARYASTRLPGKPLLPIAGKPMIEHVYERALASGAGLVIIATDDKRIQQAALAFGADVEMTSPDHLSGTDRIAEVIRNRAIPSHDIVVNLQGDEPMMPPELVAQVADILAASPDSGMATLCQRIETAAELFDPHVVKVVRDENGNALYFSRAVIPWDRDAFAVTTETLPDSAEHYRHIGLYAYRAGFVLDFVRWPQSPLERMESLEQLRVLWHGRNIHVAAARVSPGHGVDNQQDLQSVEQQMRARGLA